MIIYESSPSILYTFFLSTYSKVSSAIISFSLILSKAAYLFDERLSSGIYYDYYSPEHYGYYFLSDFFLLVEAFLGLASVSTLLEALLASYSAFANFLAFVLEC